MNKEVLSIIQNLNETLQGEPWYGKPVFGILSEVNHANAFEKPNASSHSQIELLYHMINWAAFTLNKVENINSDKSQLPEEDWTKIDASKHSWADGFAEFKNIHYQLSALLNDMDDDFLDQNVEGRRYNFRFLLNGLVQHNIYHAGQVAYISKLFTDKK